MAIISFLFLNISILIIEGSVINFCESTAIKCIVSLVLLKFTHLSIKKYFQDGERIEPFNKAVLITGCDSGFGHKLAKRLHSKGFHVFASCLFPDGEGANILKQTCTNRLKVVPLDVTKDESVEKARNFVTENLGSNVLWAIVNNAGMTKGFGIDFTTIQDVKDTFDVNTLGPVRVTKAFLPLLKKSKGRVINVASFLGRISMPGACAYIMSKHSTVAFSECLSLEMKAWGVKVISIEPDGFRTQITSYESISRSFEDTLKQTDKEIVSSYSQDYLEHLKYAQFKFCEYCSDNVNNVVDAMESAVIDRNPNLTYQPTGNFLRSVLLKILEHLPQTTYEMLIRIYLKVLCHPPSLKVKGKYS